MTVSSHLEVELKLPLPSLEGWAKRLRDLGFALQTPAQEERSELWDRGGDLLARGEALRLRSYGGRHVLTWKGARVPDAELKIRPEHEVEVSDGPAAAALLRGLGFTPTCVLLKWREVHVREGLVACLDQTPFGCFLELEGDPGGIHEARTALGLAQVAPEGRSYPELFKINKLI